MTRNNLQKHATTMCPWRILRCSHCNASHPECKTEVRIFSFFVQMVLCPCKLHWCHKRMKENEICLLCKAHLSSETQGRSVGSGKTAAKVFNNGQERHWDATQRSSSMTYLNAFLWLGAKNIFVPNHRLALSTVRRTCLARAGELSSGRVFSFSRSESEPPKFTLPVSFHPLVSLRKI